MALLILALELVLAVAAGRIMFAQHRLYRAAQRDLAWQQEHLRMHEEHAQAHKAEVSHRQQAQKPHLS